MHAETDAQGCPTGASPDVQTLPVQVAPAAHSLVARQPVRQPAVVQPNGAHWVALAVVQAPLPLHLVTGLNVLPLHDAAVVHWPSGSSPKGTLMHEPMAPGMLQLRQVPLQSALQQTFCEQKRDMQSPA